MSQNNFINFLKNELTSFVSFINSRDHHVEEKLVDDYLSSLFSHEQAPASVHAPIQPQAKPKKTAPRKKTPATTETTATETTATETTTTAAPVAEGRCIFILTKGKFKGSACNKKALDEQKYCKSHFEIIADEKEKKEEAPEQKEVTAPAPKKVSKKAPKKKQEQTEETQEQTEETQEVPDTEEHEETGETGECCDDHGEEDTSVAPPQEEYDDLLSEDEEY